MIIIYNSSAVAFPGATNEGFHALVSTMTDAVAKHIRNGRPKSGSWA